MVDKLNGEWQVVEIGLRHNSELLAFYSNDKVIEDHLKNQYNITGVKKLRRVTAGFFDGIYFQTGENEYIIPITNRLDLLKIENKKVYAVSDIIPKVINLKNSTFWGSPDPQNHSH